MALRSRGILAGVALAGSLALSASPAIGKPCGASGQSGNSEVGQYSEEVPGACDDQNIGGGNGGGQGGSSGDDSGLPSGSIQRLEQLGPAGVTTARFAQATALDELDGGTDGDGLGGPAEGRSSSSGSQAGNQVGSGDSGDGSIISAIGDLANGGSDDGMGWRLPILLFV